MSGAPDQAPIPTPQAPRGPLPADVFSTAKPVGRYPGRHHPRTGDLVVTILFSVILLVIAVIYVRSAVDRAHTDARLVDGTQLANILAFLAPIVLTVFSLVFSALFVLRRIYALWLPIVAGILIVALYSVTQDMLDHAIVSTFLG
ncbi:hypothetical protein GCM10025867_04360 [Frondihabitans sucicola]|uniref:Tripartite tricarboxylate transporter TctB family protein n=1 Tax=Frondihabitans sucicola TaxID=1268041 RepID=A0ABM8GIJ6_9MICO|nr:hypothetical protein [Frondihabitans sucicola]BDZ48195.1 hypothetical protein GCM10025867_04360 [Frondihabitans sucicola]